MMNKIIMLSIGLVFSVSCQESYNKPELFKYKNIYLGQSMAEFKSHYSKMTDRTTPHESRIGINTYMLLIDTTFVRVDFLDDIIYFMAIIYPAPLIGKIGGAETIYTKLSMKYGQETTNDTTPDEEGVKQQLIWEFENRRFILKTFTNSPSVALSIADKNKFDEVERRQVKTADVGF